LLYSTLRRGAIAQLGERLNGIQKVRGSNPLSSTNNRAITGPEGGSQSMTPCRNGGGFVVYQTEAK
jgi:hypothetical protein